MTPEEMRIAIAGKHQGWRPEVRQRYGGEDNVSGYGRNMHLSLGHPEREFTTMPTVGPNYCNDLNAMAEAEECLTMLQIGEYARSLFIVTNGGDESCITMCPPALWPSLYYQIHATAQQRAEAFCRVFWPEKFDLSPTAENAGLETK